MLRYITHAAIIAVLICLSAYSIVSNDYMKVVPTEVEVVEKTILPKDNGYSDAVIGYKRISDGMVFTCYVSVGAYVGSEVGDRVTIKVREMDVRQTPWETTRYFFGPVLLGSFTTVYLILFLIGFVPGPRKTNV